MAKKKRKLTAREKAEKARRKREFMTIFIHGKMKRVRRPQQIDGIDADEFIRRNADPLWLHQNGMWEYMEESAAAVEENSQPMKATPDGDDL
jgi:hypothetical protein